MAAPFRLSVKGGRDDLPVLSFEGREIIHWQRRFSVLVDATTAESQVVQIDPEEWIGKPATLHLGGTGSSDLERSIAGIVEEVGARGFGYELVIAAATHTLALSRDFRVFVEEDAVAIATKLLEEAGLEVDVRVLRALPKRRQCVQSFETSLDFILRILADEGIALWMSGDPDAENVVLGDHENAPSPLPGGASIRFMADGDAALVGEECVLAARISSARSPEVVSLVDYDEAKPELDQTVQAGSGSSYEHFEYPGGYRDPSVGRELAGIRRSELRSRARVLTGRTSSRRLCVGHVLELTDAPRTSMNGRWLVVELEHRGRSPRNGGLAERTYEAAFRAVPADLAYRPARLGCPGLGGVQTMDITGASGAEIHTDEQSRIKAKFRWDRRSAADDRASAWIRPMQPLLSGGFLLPRAGWEVLAGFMSAPTTTGDTPVELGRLANGSAVPPEAMPDQKVRSCFGSATTPGGGSANVLRTDDTAGNEGFLRNASRDFNDRTENDRVLEVTADDTNEVGANHMVTVGIEDKVVVLGAQTTSIGGNREVTSVGSHNVAAAAESVVIGGLRKFMVGGDYQTKCATLARVVGAAEEVVAIQGINRHVTGASSVSVGGTWAEVGGLSSAQSVLGRSSLVAGGALTVQAKNAVVNASVLTESYASYAGTAGGAITYAWASGRVKVGGALTMKGAGVLFKATSKITIKAGGVTITLTSGAIKVKGKVDGGAASVVTGEQEIG
ncbi:type VI secretion system Vgr family protein [Polyangium jinanense]|uniref:Type VI secretion system tip protein VgrG n=1 Tax=Polyangium jinanense TaxID=2829994 RepID=A0A9X3X6C3_9BACT|nr:type VI secretion system tip protein TssI/VgrG [Polyangium jinanense]MDC3955574.1 type VI secretion system tip protein VgrG [Polyangium jinanense]MDC3982216.1 type VI secretion system tip protein VgrG [Polyangium jinanense]